MKASRMIPTVWTLTVASMAAGAAFGAGWTKTVTTTATAPWVEAAPTEEPRAEATRAVVDVADGGRMVIGFGTALSELGWRAISALPEVKRATVLDGLFGSDGAALNVIRLPLGASDFSFDFFSYDETPGDFELKDFSLARDEKNLLPLIREAQQRVGKNLLVWASPWSPPQWMKKSGHYARGTC